MIKKAGFYAIKQYFSATKLHFLIFIITFAYTTANMNAYSPQTTGSLFARKSTKKF